MAMSVPPEASIKESSVQGRLTFSSLNDQVIHQVKIKMIERYARGRKEDRLIDDYTIGEILLVEPIEVKANEEIEVSFDLPFQREESEMDRIERENFLLGGFVKLAKKLKKVKSEYRIEAMAWVKGTKLNPIAKESIKLVSSL